MDYRTYGTHMVHMESLCQSNVHMLVHSLHQGNIFERPFMVNAGKTGRFGVKIKKNEANSNP